MRGFVVYESLFGNTAQIAQAVADGLEKHLDVERHSVAEGQLPEETDLLVLGGPTHAFSMSRATTRQDAVNQGANADPTIGLREWLETLPAGNDTMFATFDTRVEMVRRLPGSAAKAAAKLARKRGYQPLTRPESFYVQDTPGPLLDGEVQRAEVWGAQLAESLIGEVRDWG
jgi:flavodoxin